MKHPAPDRCEGFTLLELIAVIVILAVAAVPITGLFTKASLSMLNNQRIQTATQLAQEQAELVLGRRRNQGFNATVLAAYPDETLAGNYAGFNRTTTLTRPALPPGCPAVDQCALVTVAVDEGGTVLSEISFVLVDY